MKGSRYFLFGKDKIGWGVLVFRAGSVIDCSVVNSGKEGASGDCAECGKIS